MGKMRKLKQKIESGFFKEAWSELQWVFFFVKKYKKKMIAYSLLSLSVVLIGLFFTVQVKDLVDMLITGDWNGVIRIAIIYITVGSVNISIAVVSQRMAAKIAAVVKYEMSNKIYKRILAADWETLTQDHDSGDLLTRMSEDVDSIVGSLTGWMPSLFSSCVQMLISAIIIIYYDPEIFILVIVIAPIIVIGSRIFLAKMYESNKKQRKVSSFLMSFYKESFHNIQAIKAFGLLHSFVAKQEVILEQKKDIDLEVNRYSVLSWLVMYLSGQTAALLCLCVAIYHVYTGTISIGTMALLMILANTVSSAFKSLVSVIPPAVTMLTSSQRIRKIIELEEEPSIDTEENRKVLEAGREKGMTLEIDQVSFRYKNGKQVFENISLHAGPGEIVALVGPSGEGKTTILRLLLGIIQYEQGKAAICVGNDKGETIEIGSKTRSFMSYVPQGNTMLSGTIADNMRMLAAEATDEEIVEALTLAGAYDFVRKLPSGIYQDIGESGYGFSEGQNQRLAIARALLCNVPVLLMDEATSALDVATERKVLRNLMKRDKNKTCILTTHRPSVLGICDKVYQIKDGSVQLLEKEDVEKMMKDF